MLILFSVSAVECLPSLVLSGYCRSSFDMPRLSGIEKRDTLVSIQHIVQNFPDW